MKNPLKTLDVNFQGKDYVIGDLHGSLSALENLMKNVNFNKESDRIISVGDLVDRGPDSVGCLSLIREPWFHSVLANHEKMMIDKFFAGPTGDYWFNNGGVWGIEAWNDYKSVYIQHDKDRIPFDSSMNIIDMLPLVEQLPFLITVNTKSGKKYHIIHAELPPMCPGITDEDLADPEKVRYYATMEDNQEMDSFLWSRYIFGDLHSAPLHDLPKIIRKLKYKKVDKFFNKDLSHIISGHTILRKPVTVLGQTCIDTGAYGSYWKPVEPYQSYGVAPEPWAGLTCIDLDSWKFYQATATTFKETSPIVITDNDLS